MKAVITLDELSPAKIEVERDGLQRTIYLNMQELANFIVESVKEETLDTPYEAVKPITVSPTLPPNTVKYAKMSDDMDLIFLFHPQTKANITYHKTLFESVPFPNLVFCFGVRKMRPVVRHVFAYKDRFLRDDTQLYQFPFANVYSSGKMCYHSNEVIHDLVQLQTFPQRWIEEPFNDHLYSQGRNNHWDKSLREIFDITQGKNFDYSMLKPVNLTFYEWSNKLISEGRF